MVVLFNNVIAHNEVDELLQELRGIDASPENPIHLYFATHGGEPAYIKALVYYLNLRKDEIVVHLFDILHSAGIFMFNFKGKINIVHDNEPIWILHRIDQLVYTQRKNQGLDSKKQIKALKRWNKRLIKLYRKIGVSEKNIKKVGEGRDVYLYPKDIKKLNYEKRKNKK